MPTTLAAFSLCTVFTARPALPAPAPATTTLTLDETKLPPALTNRVDFLRDIKPIFDASCLKCHGPEKPKSRFRVDDRDALLKGGENGVAVLPGRSGKSPLIHFVARLVPDLEMPPAGKGEPLTAHQVSLLRAWIDQELPWGGQTNLAYHSLELDPTLRWMSVSGDAKMFREHAWSPDGWNGGAEHFDLREQLDPEWRLNINGHALRDDYRVALTLERNNGVFVRSGFEQYRKYFDDSGGYYAPFATPLLSLGRDLHLDLGKAWVEVGGTTPFGLQFTGGYEYQFKDGEKSLTQWQPTGPTSDPKNILPNAKSIQERLQVLRLDTAYDWRSIRFADNFRYEFHDLDTTRSVVAANYPSSSFHQSMHEGDRAQNLANAFKAEAQPREWLFVSAGYLHTQSSGDTGFRITAGAPGGPVPLYHGQGINLDQSAHVLNANAQAGLWEGMTFSSGLQTEWNRQHTLGTVHLDEYDGFSPATGNTNLVRGDHDRFIAEEKFVLRNTQIPFTVLYAEARFRQEQVQQFEELAPEGAGASTTTDFRRDADLEYDRKQYRAGFSTSPWTRAALSAHVQRRDEDDNFHDHVDERPIGAAGLGYPGFITRRQTTADELGAKLVLRPASWLKTTLSYKLLSTDYATTTDATASPVPDTDRTPGGRINGGQYDAHIYSFNGTLTPWRRVYLSSTFSLQDSEITTADHGSAAIAPYRGQVYSVLASAHYILNEQTDLNLAYNFSYADYAQHNLPALPLGLTYRLHGLQAGLGRRFWKRFTANLQYVWAMYDEPSSGHYNDYRAHGCFATLRMSWD